LDEYLKLFQSRSGLYCNQEITNMFQFVEFMYAIITVNNNANA